MKEVVDHFENGEIALTKYQLDDGTHRWWLRIGVGLLELNDRSMPQLVELMKALIEDGAV